MKKLFAVTCLSPATLGAAALGLAAGQASAWYPGCNLCCKSSCIKICCRPYNAFTPCSCGFISGHNIPFSFGPLSGPLCGPGGFGPPGPGGGWCDMNG